MRNPTFSSFWKYAQQMSSLDPKLPFYELGGGFHPNKQSLQFFFFKYESVLSTLKFVLANTCEPVIFLALKPLLLTVSPKAFFEGIRQPKARQLKIVII
jgi:hypothetical protein